MLAAGGSRRSVVRACERRSVAASPPARWTRARAKLCGNAAATAAAASRAASRRLRLDDRERATSSAAPALQGIAARARARPRRACCRSRRAGRGGARRLLDRGATPRLPRHAARAAGLRRLPGQRGASSPRARAAAVGVAAKCARTPARRGLHVRASLGARPFRRRSAAAAPRVCPRAGERQAPAERARRAAACAARSRLPPAATVDGATFARAPPAARPRASARRARLAAAWPAPRRRRASLALRRRRCQSARAGGGGRTSAQRGRPCDASRRAARAPGTRREPHATDAAAAAGEHAGGRRHTQRRARLARAAHAAARPALGSAPRAEDVPARTPPTASRAAAPSVHGCRMGRRDPRRRRRRRHAMFSSLRDAVILRERSRLPQRRPSCRRAMTRDGVVAPRESHRWQLCDAPGVRARANVKPAENIRARASALRNAETRAPKVAPRRCARVEPARHGARRQRAMPRRARRSGARAA